jgi:hypothetical protein
LKLIRLRTLVFVTAKDARRNLLKDVLQQRGVRILGMADGTLKFLELGLGGLVVELAHDGVQEIDTTESSSDDGEDRVASTLNLHLSVTSDMREDVSLAQLDQSQLSVVAVCREVFKTARMSLVRLHIKCASVVGWNSLAASAQKTKRLVKVLVVFGLLVPSAKIDSLTEEIADETRRGGNTLILRGNVVLHASPLINSQLDSFVHRTTQSPVILPRVDVVRIVFRVVDVLFRAITPKAVLCDLELACAIAEAHETKDPKQEPDSVGADIPVVLLAIAPYYLSCSNSILLDSSNIDSLGVITQPVAKVDTLDIEFAEFLVTSNDASGQESEESVFDIAMTPVLAFDLARRGDVASTESLGRTSKVDEGDEEDGEEDGGFECHGRHDVCE